MRSGSSFGRNISRLGWKVISSFSLGHFGGILHDEARCIATAFMTTAAFLHVYKQYFYDPQPHVRDDYQACISSPTQLHQLIALSTLILPGQRRLPASGTRSFISFKAKYQASKTSVQALNTQRNIFRVTFRLPNLNGVSIVYSLQAPPEGGFGRSWVSMYP